MNTKFYRVRAHALKIDEFFALAGLSPLRPPAHEMNYSKAGARESGFLYASFKARDTHALPAGDWSVSELGATTPEGTRYTPNAGRCGKGHPPLRYVSNHSCVYCARVQTRQRATEIVTPEVGADAARATMVAMGWEVGRLKRAYGGEITVRVTLPAGIMQKDIAPVLDACGWRFARRKRSERP